MAEKWALKDLSKELHSTLGSVDDGGPSWLRSMCVVHPAQCCDGGKVGIVVSFGRPSRSYYGAMH